jgi:hypothetical protein
LRCETGRLAGVPPIGREDGDEPGGIVSRERLQDYRVDERENGRVGADPERERQNADGSEARIPRERSEGETTFLEHQPWSISVRMGLRACDPKPG